MRNRLLKTVAYALWGLLTTLVFVYLTFPTDTIAEILSVQLERSLGHKYRVHIDDLSLAGLTGVTIEGLRILPVVDLPTQSSETEGEGDGESDGGESDGGESSSDDGAPPAVNLPTVIDEVAVSVGLMSLLGGDPEISFDIEVGGGLIFGSYRPDGEVAGGHRLEFSVNDVNLINIGFLSTLAQAVVTGVLNCAVETEDGGSGYAAVQFDAENNISSGNVVCTVNELTRAGGYMELGGGAALYLNTPTRLGFLRLELEFDGSDADLTLSAAGGGDLEIELGGRINVRRPTPESYALLNLQLGFSEEWKEANDLSTVLRTIPILSRICSGNQCALRIMGPLRDLRTQSFR